MKRHIFITVNQLKLPRRGDNKYTILVWQQNRSTVVAKWKGWQTARKSWVPQSQQLLHGHKQLQRSASLAVCASSDTRHSAAWTCTRDHTVRPKSYNIFLPCYNIIQCESNENHPQPLVFWYFLPSGWKFALQHAYYPFLPTLDYKFLFNYLQLWRSYVILRATTQLTSCDKTISWNALWDFLTFSETVGNFYTKFYTPIVRS